MLFKCVSPYPSPVRRAAIDRYDWRPTIFPNRYAIICVFGHVPAVPGRATIATFTMTVRSIFIVLARFVRRTPAPRPSPTWYGREQWRVSTGPQRTIVRRLKITRFCFVFHPFIQPCCAIRFAAKSLVTIFNLRTGSIGRLIGRSIFVYYLG